MNGRDLFHLENVADEEGDDEQQDADEDGPCCEEFLLRIVWDRLAGCSAAESTLRRLKGHGCACRAGSFVPPVSLSSSARPVEKESAIAVRAVARV